MLAAALVSSASQGKNPSADELLHLATTTRHAIGTCRAIARGLTPVSDASGGLVRALSDMVSQQRDCHRADVQFEAIAAAPIHLPGNVQDHLYRIAQEAVTNAQKHAGAELINVTLDIQPNLVRLEILDDGVGIATEGALSAGMGLKIMRYRAAMIGAQMSIERGDPCGTLVVCQCSQLESPGGAAPGAGDVEEKPLRMSGATTGVRGNSILEQPSWRGDAADSTREPRRISHLTSHS